MTEEEVDDLLGWTPRLAENTTFQGSGEIPVVGFNEEIRKGVENKLSDTAQKLESRLSVRMKCLPILEAAVQAFAGDYYFCVENDYEDEGKTD